MEHIIQKAKIISTYINKVIDKFYSHSYEDDFGIIISDMFMYKLSKYQFIFRILNHADTYSEYVSFKDKKFYINEIDIEISTINFNEWKEADLFQYRILYDDQVLFKLLILSGINSTKNYTYLDFGYIGLEFVINYFENKWKTNENIIAEI